MDLVILVLAKAPQAGMVKTRLCPPATFRGAARIAAACLLDTLDAVTAVTGARVAVALEGNLAGAEQGEPVRAALGAGTVFEQQSGGLGARIAGAHREVAVRWPGVPILQIGMDTPQVTPDLLGACAAPLLSGSRDAVLGHAEDGGWWALGLSDPEQAKVLAEVPTSLPDTGTRTEESLRMAGLTVERLPRLADVDTGADARQVAALAPHGRFAAAVGALL